MKMTMRKMLAILATLAILCAVLPLGSLFSAVAEGDNLVVNGGFENGVNYIIEVGTSNYINMPRFYARGDKGTAIIENWNEPMKVVVKRVGEEKDATPIKAESGLTKTMAPRDEITLDCYEIDRPTSDVHDYYRNLVRAIDGECEIFVKLGEVRRVLQVMQAAFESAASHTVLHTDI